MVNNDVVSGNMLNNHAAGIGLHLARRLDRA